MNIIITDQEKYDNRPLLPLDIKQQWIDALLNGEYEKGVTTLNNVKNNTYCCLGVLCKLQNRPSQLFEDYKLFDNIGFTLSINNPLYSILGNCGKFIGFVIENENDETEHCYNLAEMNDSGFTFKTIAYIIKTHF